MKFPVGRVGRPIARFLRKGEKRSAELPARLRSRVDERKTKTRPDTFSLFES